MPGTAPPRRPEAAACSVWRILALVATSWLISASASAEETTWGLCETPARPAAPDAPGSDTGDEIHLTGDHGTLELGGPARIWGNAVMRHGTRLLTADSLTYLRDQDRAQASGDVRFVQGGLGVSAPSAELDLATDEGRLEQARYRFWPRHARGQAELVRVTGASRAVLDGATYTTCDPDDTDWLLSASRVTLDEEAGEGRGRHVLLRFHGAPLLYSPFLSFPLDDRRKSGFLAPSIGQSDATGLELSTPYYWNIAPDRDATLSPRLLSRRGLQLRGEFRYLNRSNKGQVQAEYLDDQMRNEGRYLLAWRHRGHPQPRLSTNVAFREVSDTDYLDDLGDSLDTSSRTHLERHARLGYRLGPLKLRAQLQDFQTVDEAIPATGTPYRRMPQLLLSGQQALPGGARLGLGAEWVRFDHDDRVTGNRLDVMPILSWPLRRPGYFLEPSVRLRHTTYDLDRDDDPRPARTLPILSLDGGLIFERETGQGHLQTLEPRLYYLYTPFEDQEELPVFDTSRVDFNFNQLFRDHRFTGPDRVGDANRLTVALSSRLYDGDTGRQRLEASVGQIVYLSDRKVTLPRNPPQDTDLSDLAAELAYTWSPRWRTRTELLWDPEREQTDKATAEVQYRRGSQRVVNLGYRFRRHDIDQLDLSAAWPLSRRWQLVGRWNHSLRDKRLLELLGGVEYESCCWRVRFVGRRYVTDEDGDYNTSIHLQLVLKGLTSLGSSIRDLLEQGITGYELER